MKKIFIFSFVISAVIQGFIFTKLGILDFDMWTKQTEYVQTNNPAQFDFLAGYGHPGGPIIEGTILLRHIFDWSYEKSLLVFMTLLNAFFISGASTLCYLINKNNLWWLAVLTTLSSNWLYLFSTPPSIIISILIPFLVILSLYLFNKKEVNLYLLIFLSIIIGFILATRIDIGAVMATSFLIFLKPKINWRQIILVIIGSFLSFVLFDPFMWFMPIQHIKDLLFKIVYHYGYFTPTKVSVLEILHASFFVITSIFLSFIFLIIRKKITPPLPSRFIYSLLAPTIFLCIIFLTAQYQTLRYFLPLINLWQAVLPLWVFTLLANSKTRLSEISESFFALALVFHPFISLFFYI